MAGAQPAFKVFCNATRARKAGTLDLDNHEDDAASDSDLEVVYASAPPAAAAPNAYANLAAAFAAPAQAAAAAPSLSSSSTAPTAATAPQAPAALASATPALAECHVDGL